MAWRDGLPEAPWGISVSGNSESLTETTDRITESQNKDTDWVLSNFRTMYEAGKRQECGIVHESGQWLVEMCAVNNMLSRSILFQYPHSTHTHFSVSI